MQGMKEKTMKVKAPHADVGVLVGRFQVPNLHDGHKQLIQHVVDAHQKVIVFLGLSPCRVTRQNPLDFEARKQMLLAAFPTLNVLYIKDSASDKVWSKNLDDQIATLSGPTSSVILYGSRECFIAHYTGKHKTCELEQEVYTSGVEVRDSISSRCKASQEFREGVIWAAYNQYPRIMPTVDVAIWDENREKLLFARKADETLYRFIGGFVEAKETLEANCRREVEEEAHISIDDIRYVGSHVVDDWRYRRELDKIMTVLFEAKRIFGNPTPDDDIAEVRWFDVKTLKETDLVVEHRPLLKMLLEKNRG
jgi:bifunctional NMN adenylyltransferase/nudix hydrolase